MYSTRVVNCVQDRLYVRMLVYLLLLYILLVELDLASTDCSDGWFGYNCSFQCHCNRSAKCNMDGSCPNGEPCKIGYFGPACQYVDLVNSDSSTFTKLYLRDSNHDTCNPDKRASSLTVSLLRPFPLTWFRVHVDNNSNEADLLNFAVNLNFRQKCSNGMKFLVNSTVVDVVCYNTISLTQLQIVGSVVPHVCTIFISGGRNVAIKQPSTQTSCYETKTSRCQSSNAVDGNRDSNYDHYSCSNTKSEITGAEWNLTFIQPQDIYRILIYNRDSDKIRLDQFKLRTFDEAGNRTTMYTNSVSKADVYEVPITSRVPVKKVSIKQSTQFTRAQDKALTICEVEVYGENQCPDNRYGLLCNDSCQISEAEVCHAATGAHALVCQPGLYGRNCSSPCSKSCLNDICGWLSGSCIQCADGYYGNKCDKPCAPGTYGQACKFKCSAHCTQICNHTNGECSCTKQFTGDLCEDCIAGFYGDICTDKCPTYCSDNLCHRVTGQCLLCIGNRRGLFCEGCSETFFGPACDLECAGNCLNETCDDVSGLCVYCAEGYDGDYCLGEEPTYFLFLTPFLPMYLMCCTCFLACAERIHDDDDEEAVD